MERHTQNATELATFLKAQKLVKRVLYPKFDGNLKMNPDLDAQMSGYGGMLAFEIHGGVDGAIRFLNNLKLCKVAVSLGDPATLVEHPGLMTHAVVPKNEREKLGITENLIRVSVGLEDVADIAADIEQAFDAV
jgi:methionine-gamma-lyase